MAMGKKAGRVSAAKRFAEIERISIFGITERMGPIGLHMYAEAISSPPVRRCSAEPEMRMWLRRAELDAMLTRELHKIAGAFGQDHSS